LCSSFLLLHAGEYIAVEKIENVLKSCPLVEQVWVYGNSFESCLVAVAVPAEKPIMVWAAARGIRGTYQVGMLKHFAEKQRSGAVDNRCQAACSIEAG
jgi:long-subunit acyl-CoA synthetase (AMP-forming)